MPRLPSPSPGVLQAPFADGLALFEPRRGMLHLVVGSAEVVWRACAEATQVDDLVDAVADGTTDRTTVAADVARFCRELKEAGLVDGDDDDGRQHASEPHPTRHGSHRSRPLVVLDERVVVSGDDAALVTAVEAAFGTTDDPSTTDVVLASGPDGLLLTTPDGSHPVDPAAPLVGVVAALNQRASRSHSVLVLHAGAVRSPDGHVVVLAGPSQSGKSTLTAQMVRAGWGYLGDEAVGITPGTFHALPYPKPLSLRPPVRRALGLDGGTGPVPLATLAPGARWDAGPTSPVAAIVLPRYEAGAPVSTRALTGADAIVGVAANAFNLARAGQEALATAVSVAEQVPVVELRHGGGEDAAAAVAAVVAPR